LTAEKNLLDRYSQSSSKDWDLLAQEQTSIRLRHNQFLSDYAGWLPGFLKEHGYELGEGK